MFSNAYESPLHEGRAGSHPPSLEGRAYDVVSRESQVARICLPLDKILSVKPKSSSGKLRFNVVPFVVRGTRCKCTSRDTLSYMCTIVDKLAHSRTRSIYCSGSSRTRRVANSERIKYVFEGGSSSYCFKRITQHRMFRYLLRQTIIAAAVPPDRLFNTFAVFVASRWPWCPF